MPCGCCAALRMGRVPCGENLFFFCGEAECFLFCSWFLPARIGCTPCGKTTFSFACPAGATVQPLGAGCLLVAMPLRDSSCPVGAVPPYGWGRSPCGENHFFACPAGAKTAFSFQGKENSGSGLRKRKGGPVGILGRCVTTGRWICAVMVSLG